MNSIKINPYKAYLTRDTEVMSQMDPFIVLTLGTQKFKTQTKQQGGKKVMFTEQFIVNPQGNNLMTVAVMDEDQMTNDEVGTGSIDLNPYFRGKAGAESISLKFDNKPAGKVLLRIVNPNQSIETINMIQQKNQPIKFCTPEDIMKELASGSQSQNSVPPQYSQIQSQLYPNQNSQIQPQISPNQYSKHIPQQNNNAPLLRATYQPTAPIQNHTHYSPTRFSGGYYQSTNKY